MRRLGWLLVWLLGLLAVARLTPPLPVRSLTVDGSAALAGPDVVLAESDTRLTAHRYPDGRPLWATLRTDDPAVRSVDLLADGRRVAVSVPRGTESVVELREVASGRLVNVFPPDTYFSPDGRRAVRTDFRGDVPDPRRVLLTVVEADSGRPLWWRAVRGWRGFSRCGRWVLLDAPEPPPLRTAHATDTGQPAGPFCDPADTSFVRPVPPHLLDEDKVVWDVPRLRPVGRGRESDPEGGDFRWRAADGGRRTADAPAGWQVGTYDISPAGNLVWASLKRDREPSAVAAWVARQHPRLAPLAITREDRSLAIDPDTGRIVAELSDGSHPGRLSADGRRLVTITRRPQGVTRFDEWNLPLRPHRGLLFGLAAGWTAVALLARRRWGRQPQKVG